MNLTAKDPVPLATDTDGVVRVGGTRITLDTVVAVFDQGATPEEIVTQYPSLQLADVYAVVGFCLKHRSDVDEYLQQRHIESDRIRTQNENRCDLREIRERLQARRSK